MTTFATLVSFLAAALAATPSQPVTTTLVHRPAADRAPAARRAERTVDIVTDGPGDVPARPLRELFGARVVLADGGIVTDGPGDVPARPLRELFGARVVLADGDFVTDGSSSPPSPVTPAVVQVARARAR